MTLYLPLLPLFVSSFLPAQEKANRGLAPRPSPSPLQDPLLSKIEAAAYPETALLSASRCVVGLLAFMMDDGLSATAVNRFACMRIIKQ